MTGGAVVTTLRDPYAPRRGELEMSAKMHIADTASHVSDSSPER